MDEKETIQKLDSELLALMLATSKFINGRATLTDLKKAQEAAEKFRCFAQY